MQYVAREDSIDLLPFPGRVRNRLRRAGIHTVGQLLDYPKDQLQSLKNMGQKGSDTVENVIAQLIQGDDIKLAESPTIGLPNSRPER